ncbi:hypothetical protein BDA96_10G174300 [Sorghum bicolor]|uniref:Uncharacterized protein n=2 Tax=Sorghum bicolor TaxID=4558 RepID=A0A921Q2Q2_SORBI|nr:hypothetical protein BDA96_10G174300 [Sorghum bicolor]KXG19945.1 hypothetical protein SORBI_3010G137000 [Sorghum bicolor]
METNHSPILTITMPPPPHARLTPATVLRQRPSSSPIETHCRRAGHRKLSQRPRAPPERRLACDLHGPSGAAPQHHRTRVCPSTTVRRGTAAPPQRRNTDRAPVHLAAASPPRPSSASADV